MPTQDTWAPVSGLIQSSYSGSRIRTWVKTPNWGAIPKDQKPVNPYNDLKYITLTQSNAYAYHLQGGVKYVDFGPAPAFTGNQLVLDFNNALIASDFVNKVTPVQNSLMIKALGAISDQKINLAVALAESAKTADLILSTANRIDRAYRALRRGQFQRVAQILNINPKNVHKTWLEYKYGWQPLLMDVVGGAEALAQYHIGRPPRFTVKKTGKTTVRWSSNGTYAAFGGGAPGTFTETLVSEYKCTVKLWCELTNSRLSTAQQLGLTNPQLVAWELIPFSFVFDWFIHVGNYCQAISALDGVTVRRSLRSNVNDHTYVRSQPATSRVGGAVTYVNEARERNIHQRHYARSVPDLSPSELYPPKSKGISSWEKVITSLALLKGQYRASSTRI